MDFANERTSLISFPSSHALSEREESLLKRNRTKWVVFVSVLLIGVVTVFAATQYNGPTRNPRSQNQVSSDDSTTTTTNTNAKTPTQPHVIWFVADDLGQSDISLHGSEIATPNIDALAKDGIELTSHYVMPLCSPSRASFLTGRHAFRLGVQATMSDLVKPQSIAHIPSSYTLAGEYFQSSGYKTYAYGKWHVGYAKQSYTPTSRGFDHHTGFYQFAIDYNSKLTLDDQVGFDWFVDGKVNWDASDESLYTTFILADAIEADLTQYKASDQSDPLFMYVAFQNPHFLVSNVPDEFESDCDNVLDADRREYCAHVQVLDFAVGRVVSVLKELGLYENSIIAFATDNGVLALNLCGNPGGHSAAGSAYPLRGGKYTLFEGGVKTPAFISGGFVSENAKYSKLKGTQSDVWFQGADWLPTLLHATADGSDKFFEMKSKSLTNLDDLDDDVSYFAPDGKDLFENLFGKDEFDDLNEFEPDLDELDALDSTKLNKFEGNGRKLSNIDDLDALDVLDDILDPRKESDGYMVLNLDWKDEYGGYVDTGLIYNDVSSGIIYKLIYNHELYCMGSCDVRSAEPGSYPFETDVNEEVTFKTNYANLYLFELSNDPNEENDLLGGLGAQSEDISKYEDVLDKMFDILDAELMKGFMEQQDKTVQDDGDSTNFDGAWEPWLDEDDDEFVPKETSVLAAAKKEMQKSAVKDSLTLRHSRCYWKGNPKGC